VSSEHRQAVCEGDIALFSTKDDVVAIESPIKGMILGMMTTGEISFDEIVSRTRKAKSTISVHIKDLEDAGLVISRPDPDDHRRKLLTMLAEPIGCLTNKDRYSASAQLEESQSELPFDEGDIASFFRSVLKVIRTEAMNHGININPVLERAGFRIGTALAPMVADLSLQEKIIALDKFWKNYGLGTITLVSDLPITLNVHGCFECEDLPVTGHGACSFDIGVLSALFLRETGGRPVVREVECYSSGFDHCTFIITKNQSLKN